MENADQKPQPYPPIPNTDHDAIVTLVSEMRQLRKEVSDLKTVDMKELKDDVKEVKDNVADRVADLENEKLDKVEADKLVEDGKKVQQDFETRIRTLEQFKENWSGKYVVIAAIVGILITVIIEIGFRTLGAK